MNNKPTWLRRRLKLALICLCLIGLALIWPAAPQPTGPGPGNLAAGYNTPFVRLRKLHLVRPDLIPYPIEYNVYC